MFDTFNQTPSYVQAIWHVPNAGAPQTINETDYSAIWPGLGGITKTGTLIQDGTEQDTTCTTVHAVCHVVQTYYFWIEIVPGPNERVTNLVPKPGDRVEAITSWDSSNGAQFGLCDYAQKKCVFSGAIKAAAPGNSADWIVERPELCINHKVTITKLANFGTVGVTHAEYGFNGKPQYPMSNGVNGFPVRANIYDSERTKLDETSGVGSDNQSFTVSWRNFGTVDPTTQSC